MKLIRRAIVIGLLMSSVTACNRDMTSKCVEGASVACTCPSGASGAQTCTARGAFGACSCNEVTQRLRQPQAEATTLPQSTPPATSYAAAERTTTIAAAKKPTTPAEKTTTITPVEKTTTPVQTAPAEMDIVGKWAGTISIKSFDGENNESEVTREEASSLEIRRVDGRLLLGDGTVLNLTETTRGLWVEEHGPLRITYQLQGDRLIYHEILDRRHGGTTEGIYTRVRGN